VSEPTTPDDVQRWIADRLERIDPFRRVYESSEAHRLRHGTGCTVYPTGSGPLLGTLARAIGARRVLEVGCGIGYSALWLAYGSGPNGHVDTIERSADHAEIARRTFAEEGYADRIVVHLGSGASALPRLGGPYDLVFCDADLDEYPSFFQEFLRLLSPKGTLLTSNLFLGLYGADLPGLEQAALYRERLLLEPSLLTAFIGRMAISVRRD
jgi:predicted O-methyltransferase YrrM